jgi:hypothetical protein
MIDIPVLWILTDLFYDSRNRELFDARRRSPRSTQ